MTDEKQRTTLSTSALAKQLGISSQYLFSTLKDYGWIRRLDEGWGLTGKGEFEGGEFIHSKRYGRYIVWPEALVDHPLLKALEDHRTVSATELGKALSLNVREVNRLLAELGWIKHGIQGWELTGLGQQHDGVQLENEHSGIFYVMWPETIQNNLVLQRQLQMTADIYSKVKQEEGDLFDSITSNGEFQSIDGHRHSNHAHLNICHWLYLAGIAHACHRQLPVTEELYADFYLPAHQLFIECWGGGDKSNELNLRMRRKETYKELGLSVIDINLDEDMVELDELLTRELRKQGIRVY